MVHKPVKGPGGEIRGPKGLLGHLVSCVFQSCGFRYVVMFVLVFMKIVTGIRKAVFAESLVSGCVAPFLLSNSAPGFAPLTRTVKGITYFCKIKVITACTCGQVVVGIARKVVVGVEGSLFDRVRGLPVGCFSARTRNSVVSVCAGSVSALERVIDRDVPRVVGDKFAVIDMFVDVLVLGVPLATIAVIVITVVV